MAVQIATARLDDRQFAELDSYVLGGDAVGASNDPNGVRRADRDFLFALFRAADAPMLDIVESPWLRRGPPFWEVRWIILGRTPPGNQHREICRAARGTGQQRPRS